MIHEREAIESCASDCATVLWPTEVLRYSKKLYAQRTQVNFGPILDPIKMIVAAHFIQNIFLRVPVKNHLNPVMVRVFTIMDDSHHYRIKMIFLQETQKKKYFKQNKRL